MSRRAQAARRTVGATLVEQLQDQQQSQDLSAVQLIERGAVTHKLDGSEWLDTRPMLDLREVHPETADEAQQALQFAVERGLLEVNAQQPHLVRIARRPL